MSWFIVLCAPLFSSWSLHRLAANTLLGISTLLCVTVPGVPPLGPGGVYVPWKITSPWCPGYELKPTSSSLMFRCSQVFTPQVRLSCLNPCAVLFNKYYYLLCIFHSKAISSTAILNEKINKLFNPRWYSRENCRDAWGLNRPWVGVVTGECSWWMNISSWLADN